MRTGKYEWYEFCRFSCVSWKPVVFVIIILMLPSSICEMLYKRTCMYGHDCHLVTTNCAATSEQIVEECRSIHVHLKYLVLSSSHSARIPSKSYEWRLRIATWFLVAAVLLLLPWRLRLCSPTRCNKMI
jgi:hypothetical protein